jgi:hypothetical protein
VFHDRRQFLEGPLCSEAVEISHRGTDEVHAPRYFGITILRDELAAEAEPC